MTTGVAAMAAGYAAFRYMSSPKSANHAYFDGKVVWVTGASSGIGKELCKQLVEKSKGVRLILSSRKEETLREVKEELVAAGARAKDVAIVAPGLGRQGDARGRRGAGIQSLRKRGRSRQQRGNLSAIAGQDDLPSRVRQAHGGGLRRTSLPDATRVAQNGGDKGKSPPPC